MTADVVIRVDASVKIGTGHVFRMLVLAEMARACGLVVLFFVRHLPSELRQRVLDTGFAIQELDGSANEPMDTWLGVPLDAEINAMLASLRSLKRTPRTVVLDHYELGARWEAAVSETGARVFVVDDLANRRHHCDVLLDATVGPPDRYEGLLAAGTRTLLGPPYALVREQFVRERQKRRARTASLRRVLVFYGGIDESGESVKALCALRSIAGDLEIDVVPGMRQIEAVQQAAALDSRVCVRYDVAEWALLTAAADLVLGAGGTASWERCFVGTPTLATSVAANQVGVTSRLAATGSIRYLGVCDAVTEVRIIEALSELRDEPEKLLVMSERSFALCEGYAEARAAIVEEL